MRLFATGRALRASRSRWSIASSRRVRPSAFQHQQKPALRAGARYAGTQATKAPEESQATGRAGQSKVSTDGVTVENKTYATDEWSNAPAHILSHVGRCLYLNENHPLSITRKLIESQFPGPVFGNHVELQPIVSPSKNFDVLGFPLDHPGRSRTDTYYVNKDNVLRTHSSAHQQQYFQLLNQNEKTRPEEEGYTLMADVYRRDAIDRSHYPVFHQMELARLWKRSEDGQGSSTADKILKDLETIPRHDVKVEDPNPAVHPERNPLQGEHSLEEAEALSAHLKRSLERLVVKIFTEADKASKNGDSTLEREPLKVRWIEAYFPFTSPSYELEVFYQGDWLEVLGCGVIKQDLLNNSDVPHRIGWAAGLGIERIAMLLFNIPDIRLFWSQDERFLSQFGAGEITRFVPFSKHPACYKDVSFWLRPSGTSGGGTVPFHENDMMEIVRDIAGDLVEDVTPVDEFTHPKTGRKSVCYRINYRSLERTLTNEETNGLHEKVRQRLVEKLGVELR
jgi:phenylalanyl-tRNA synthetase alpha chain